MTSKIDFCKAPEPNLSPHWWHTLQAESGLRRRGYYFWTPDERWCYGPYAQEAQAVHAQHSYEAGLGIPDFDEET